MTIVLTIATVVGFGIADNASDKLLGGVNGFAAGALLVMLVDSMIPEAATRRGAPPASSRRSASPWRPGCRA